MNGNSPPPPDRFDGIDIYETRVASASRVADLVTTEFEPRAGFHPHQLLALIPYGCAVAEDNELFVAVQVRDFDRNIDLAEHFVPAGEFDLLVGAHELAAQAPATIEPLTPLRDQRVIQRFVSRLRELRDRWESGGSPFVTTLRLVELALRNQHIEHGVSENRELLALLQSRQNNASNREQIVKHLDILIARLSQC